MVGKYEIEIYNKNVHYFLTVKRNITIIQGYSATGKTELIRLISQHEIYGESSGITVKSSVSCHVLAAVNWEMNLATFHKSIIFIDENVNFTKSKRFAEIVKESDNYFVIVTRDDLHELPYSVDEIYGLRNDSDTQKYKTFHKVYNEMYRLYNLNIGQEKKYETVITEDSNAGYEFFSKVYGEKCISAGGKSKIYEIVVSNQKPSLIVADGAAFGPEIGKIMRYIQSNGRDCVIYAPESFEYLILCSGILNVDERKLLNTYDFADSTEYMSWERFYTKYLTDVSKGTVYQYSKGKLNESYLTAGAFKKILEQLPDGLHA